MVSIPGGQAELAGLHSYGQSRKRAGQHFALALSENRAKLFASFGQEKITKGSHLEKLCLIRDRVDRDNISDFTTNLMKSLLFEYTEIFAGKHLDIGQTKTVAAKIEKAAADAVDLTLERTKASVVLNLATSTLKQFAEIQDI